jgi:hypothetical protein
MPSNRRQIATVPTDIKRTTSPYSTGLFRDCGISGSRLTYQDFMWFFGRRTVKNGQQGEIPPKTLIRGNRLLATMMFNRTGDG